MSCSTAGCSIRCTSSFCSRCCRTAIAVRALAAIPMVAKPSKAEQRDRVKESFEKPLAPDTTASYTLEATG
jgi:hypothetical protein